MIRDRAYLRKVNWKHAIRKQRIVKERYSAITEWYDNLHQYSKNKIHCSCPLCRARGLYKGSNSKLGIGHAELRELDKLNYQDADFITE